VAITVLFGLYVDGHISEAVDMPIGCVQGSVLGPRLFTLYLSELQNILKHKVISYADDSYVIVKAKSLEELKEQVKHTSTMHTLFLKKLGMVVNSSKTEIVIFNRRRIYMSEEFQIDQSIVKSQEKFKALGVIFQHDLKWNDHVSAVISRVNPKLSMLKKVGKNLKMQQFLKVATAQLFSIIYYAAPVWLNKTLTSDLWRKLKSLHYRILRAAKKDYKRVIPNQLLDKECKRATPKMWSEYATTTMAIKVLRDRSPFQLFNHLNENLYIQRRKPNNGRFYDTSAGKIGRHKFQNRLETLTNLDRPWHELDLSDNLIRIILKKTLNFDFE